MSTLPCRLSDRLLTDGWRLLLAVEGLDESPVPCLILECAPTEAERIQSCAKGLVAGMSDV